MAKCKWCGKSGWFMKVDGNGLCSTCQITELSHILGRCRIVLDSVKLIHTSKNRDTRLSRINLTIEHCEALTAYDRKGIPTLTMPPVDVISEMENIRESIVDDLIREQVFTARRKATDGISPSAKLSGYGKAIEVLDEVMNGIPDVSKVERAIILLREERDGIHFDTVEQKADAAIAKGNVKAAIGFLIDAILLLKNDSTPDHRQRDRYDRARLRIIELGGTPPDMVLGRHISE